MYIPYIYRYKPKTFAEPHVASNVRYIPYNENKLCTHTLQARCGTFLTSAIRLISLSHTPLSKVRYIPCDDNRHKANTFEPAVRFYDREQIKTLNWENGQLSVCNLNIWNRGCCGQSSSYQLRNCGGAPNILRFRCRWT